MIWTALLTNHSANSVGVLYFTCLYVVSLCSASSIFACSYQLRIGDYSWWWSSFVKGGFSGVYSFIFFYYIFPGNSFLFSFNEFCGTESSLLYFVYTLIIAFLHILVIGCISFISCFFYIRKLHRVNEWRTQEVWMENILLYVNLITRSRYDITIFDETILLGKLNSKCAFVFALCRKFLEFRKYHFIILLGRYVTNNSLLSGCNLHSYIDVTSKITQ